MEQLGRVHFRKFKPKFGQSVLRDVQRELVIEPYRIGQAPQSSPLFRLAKMVEFASGGRISIVRRQGLDLLEHIMARGIVAGGSEVADYLEGQWMEHVFSNTAIFAVPANVFVALWTAATGEANDSGTEVVGGAYARQAVSTSGGWDAVVDGATANSGNVDFGTATASWGTITAATLEDAATAVSNRFFYSILDASKLVNLDDTFKFATGDLTASVD